MSDLDHLNVTFYVTGMGERVALQGADSELTSKRKKARMWISSVDKVFDNICCLYTREDQGIPALVNMSQLIKSIETFLLE